MKAEDLKGKTFDELQKTLMDLRKEQFNLRFQRSNGQLEDTAKMRKARRNIARVKTFMSSVKSDANGTDKTAEKAPAKKAASAKSKAKKAA